MISESKNPPCAEIAEQAVIATIFDNPNRWLPRLRASGVTSESFWTHRMLFKAVADFIDQNGGIEPIAFTQELQSAGSFDRLGGAKMMETLLYPAYSTHGWEKWVEQIQEAYAQRIAYNLHQQSGEYQDSEEAANTLQTALEAIKKAKEGPRRSIGAREATEAFAEQFKTDREAGEIPGKSTGIFELDAVSGGMRPGELWVVCGRPSRGKSVLMFQIATEVMKEGGRVGIFSLEMSTASVVGRIATVAGKLDYNHITKPREVKTQGDVQRISKALQQVAAMRFRIDDAPNQTKDHIVAEAAVIRDTDGPLDLIVVDYIQLMEGDRRRNESREQEVARASRALKQMAKEFGCPVLSASQLNDEGRVRESRAIEQDADALLFIADDGVKIVKMRNGRRDDTLPLILDGQHQRFVRSTP